MGSNVATICVSPILVSTGSSVRAPVTDHLPFGGSFYVVLAS